MSQFRTNIAALGSGGALIAAVIVALIALGGVVAVEGLPNSSNRASEGDVEVQAAVPETAAAARLASNALEAGLAPGPPAAKDADHAPQVPGRGHAGFAPGGTRGGTPQPLPPIAGLDGPPTLTPPLPGPPGPPHSPPPHHPPGHAPPPPPLPGAPAPVPNLLGAFGGLVSHLDETVHGVTGLSPGLPGTLSPITDPIDGTIGGHTGGNGSGPGATPQIPSIVRP